MLLMLSVGLKGTHRCWCRCGCGCGCRCWGRGACHGDALVEVAQHSGNDVTLALGHINGGCWCRCWCWCRCRCWLGGLCHLHTDALALASCKYTVERSGGMRASIFYADEYLRHELMEESTLVNTL